jgi:hypothetical protein
MVCMIGTYQRRMAGKRALADGPSRRTDAGVAVAQKSGSINPAYGTVGLRQGLKPT